MCQTGDRDHLGRAEQKAEARHDDAAEARALALAAHAVEREQQRRQQDVHHTERIEPQVPRLDDEHDARHVQHEPAIWFFEIVSCRSRKANSVTNTGLLENSTPTTEAWMRVTDS